METFVVDAFTLSAFTGNPAAVCCTKHEVDEKIMKKITLELNQPVTCFVSPHSETDFPAFNIQVFTTSVELPICGHGTFAAAYVLFFENGLPDYQHATNVTFHTKTRGVIHAKKMDDKVEIDMPLGKPDPLHLSTNILQQIMNNFQIDSAIVEGAAFESISGKLLIHVSSEDHVKSAQISESKLMETNFGSINNSISGVILTSRSKDGIHDICSRFFTPWHGVHEDHVTGSAHAVIGAYFHKVLQQNKFVAYQASQRTGVLHLNIMNDRILISGHCRTVIKGVLG
jgi:PhzF family phenazine biosynthesis protein